MIYTDEDIRKYQDLCLKYFDEEIDKQAAIREMSSLIFMVSLVYRPANHVQLEQLKNKSHGRDVTAEPSYHSSNEP